MNPGVCALSRDATWPLRAHRRHLAIERADEDVTYVQISIWGGSCGQTLTVSQSIGPQTPVGTPARARDRGRGRRPGSPAPRGSASEGDRHEQTKGCSGGAKPSRPESRRLDQTHEGWVALFPRLGESPRSASPALSAAPLLPLRAAGRVNRRQMAEAKASSSSSSAVLLTHTHTLSRAFT